MYVSPMLKKLVNVQGQDRLVDNSVWPYLPIFVCLCLIYLCIYVYDMLFCVLIVPDSITCISIEQ